MSKETGLPKIARRRSSVHGDGVFAVEPIARNTRIVDYAGELVRNGPESRAREERDLEAGCVWVFRINRAWSRDAAVDGTDLRLRDHRSPHRSVPLPAGLPQPNLIRRG